MDSYDFKKIEKKWQKIWEKENYGKSKDFDSKPKHYNLVEFPYPSGAGLHVGHCMGYGASDAYCRMKRMQGFNVMYPMGWDAFGLPTENYAIKNKVKPQKVTDDSIRTFKRQMKMLGLSFDWDREINTTDPAYYKWTQWIFLQFYRHGFIDGKLIEIADDDTTTPRLAYQAEMPINWCPSCKIGLANEEVIAGACERCGTPVVLKMQKQWMLRITAYADRLIKDLDTVDYLDKIKTQQINWIGKSEGTNIKFKLDGEGEIEVFTTRTDTLFGCTYIVLAPEHQLISKLKSQISNWAEVEKYIEDAAKKSDLDRTEIEKDKTGVELKGITATNPINNEKIPVWVADYCLASYGTGAVMAVPAHDKRDFEFATKYNLPIKEVVEPLFEKFAGTDAVRKDLPFVERHPVVAVVKHWSEEKFLCLRWPNTDWRGFVVGGIEDGEDDVKAAIREIIEETGYLHPKFIKKLGGKINARFFQVNKNDNRWAHFQPMLFELADEEHQEISEEEKKIHEIHWIEKEKVDKFLSWVSDMKLIWHRAITDDYYFGAEAANDHVTVDGILVDSNDFNGLTSEEGKKKITEKLKSEAFGDFATNYKLRDWVFSRQHYWGEPIPIIHCDKCGTVPVPEEELPVILPDVEHYEPSNTGESPLATISAWINTTCPKCGGKARRETDTMPNWAGSSWYFLRYCDPKNTEELASMDKLKYWLDAGLPRSDRRSATGVDLYNGGMEHTTLHLLYSRFWHKFLFDLGVVPGAEPYKKRIAHGIILGPDRQKMSKSRGNVINPDEMVEQFGADTLRAYIMFIGPYDQESAWNMNGIKGVFRFLNRVWQNAEKISKKDDSEELLIKLNQTIAGVTNDLETYQLNTVVSKLMELNNAIEKAGSISKDSFKKYLMLLFPTCPHIAEELWEKSGFEGKIEERQWPKADEKYLVAQKITIAVQINGKTRDIIEVDTSADQSAVEAAAQTEKIKKDIGQKNIKKVIYVAGRIVNFVIE